MDVKPNVRRPTEGQPEGFTLLEIAFVMIIIGLLAGGGVSLMKNLTERKMRTETVDSLQQARSSLTSFVVNNGRLPWADSDDDGLENSGSNSGTLPYLTLQTIPTDAYKRAMGYAVNANLVTDRASSCNALRAGLSTAPSVVDADGATTAFFVAVALISGGPMDADGNGTAFDILATGTHQGNNITGVPNYLRHPPLDTFDDIAAYISTNELYAHLCEFLDLAVNNNSGATVYVFDVNQGVDLGSVTDGGTALYKVLSGSQIRLLTGAGGGGTTATSEPPTPITLAGQSATLNLPSP